MKRILLVGLPGSGKTTQAKRLNDELKLCLVSVGDALREMAEEDNSLGQLVKSEMSKGDFVDDDIAARVVRQKIGSSSCEDGFLVDGYPRSLTQLEMYDPEFNQVIYLHISKEEAKKRLLLRGRVDDDSKVVEHRLNVYEAYTQPIIDYFEGLGLVKKVEGSADIEVTYQRIMEVLK